MLVSSSPIRFGFDGVCGEAGGVVLGARWAASVVSRTPGAGRRGAVVFLVRYYRPRPNDGVSARGVEGYGVREPFELGAEAVGRDLGVDASGGPLAADAGPMPSRVAVPHRQEQNRETEPRTGQFVTVFRSRVRASSVSPYCEHAARMGALAATMAGYLEHESFVAEDGERITLVTFTDQAGHDAWRDHPAHGVAQRIGIAHYYPAYSIAVGYASSSPAVPSPDTPGSPVPVPDARDDVPGRERPPEHHLTGRHTHPRWIYATVLGRPAAENDRRDQDATAPPGPIRGRSLWGIGRPRCRRRSCGRRRVGERSLRPGCPGGAGPTVAASRVRSVPFRWWRLQPAGGTRPGQDRSSSLVAGAATLPGPRSRRGRCPHTEGPPNGTGRQADPPRGCRKAHRP